MGDPPANIDQLDQAFITRGAELTPAFDDVPDEFKSESNPWVRLVDGMFFGLVDPLTLELLPVDGIDPEQAWTHVQVVMGTWETKHQHKLAGAAWLMSQWFTACLYRRKRYRLGDRGLVIDDSEEIIEDINWPD